MYRPALLQVSEEHVNVPTLTNLDSAIAGSREQEMVLRSMRRATIAELERPDDARVGLERREAASSGHIPDTYTSSPRASR